MRSKKVCGSVRQSVRPNERCGHDLITALECRRLLTTIVVTGVGDTIAYDGVTTLREAITAANTNAPCGDAPAGQPGGTATDQVTFNIPGVGTHTITPQSNLPIITDRISLDATTQPGFNTTTYTPVVVLDGIATPEDADGTRPSGFHLQAYGAGYSIIKGFEIIRYAATPSATGIYIEGVPNVGVFGNFIGTNGTTTYRNTAGIWLEGGRTISAQIGSPNRADRNVISGNAFGIMGNGPYSVTIQGNYIGLNAAGTGTASGVTADDDGIYLTLGELSSRSLIGGTAVGAGNVIAGGYNGIWLGAYLSGATGVVVQGNYVGTNAAGNAAVPTAYGISVGTGIKQALIGGNTAAARNVVSGCTEAGIWLNNNTPNSNGVSVIGNYVGTNASGSATIANAIGIQAYLVHGKNVIGGTGPTDGNLISGNTVGVDVYWSTEVEIYGNRIGTDPTGTLALKNTGPGIRILSATNTVGSPTGGNTIAFNGGPGVLIAGSSATGNSVRYNSIFGNNGIGIDLTAASQTPPYGDRITPNDAGDPDAGGNNLQNFPVMSSATVTAASGTTPASITVAGSLSSQPSTGFNIDVYADSAIAYDNSVQGRRYLGTITVSTSAAGSVGFSKTFNISVPAGWFVTATATRLSSPTDTSEFGTAAKAVASGGFAVSSSPSKLAAATAREPSTQPTPVDVVSIKDQARRFAVSGGDSQVSNKPRAKFQGTHRRRAVICLPVESKQAFLSLSLPGLD